MVAERKLGVLEPDEDAPIALVKDAAAASDVQPRNDLVDQLPFAFGRQSCEDFLIIEYSTGEDRLIAAGSPRPQGVEVGKARNRINQPPLLHVAPTEHGPDGRDHSDCGHDVDEDQAHFEQNGCGHKYGQTAGEEQVAICLTLPEGAEAHYA